MSVTNTLPKPTMNRQSRIESLAWALYQATREPDDPPYELLEASERHEFRSEARGVLRHLDPVAKAVAIERAAEAYATTRGWDWPSLHGYAVHPGTDLALARADMRLRIRFLAKATIAAYDRHLQEGNPRDVDGLEESYQQAVLQQKQADSELRAERKPIRRGDSEYEGVLTNLVRAQFGPEGSR